MSEVVTNLIQNVLAEQSITSIKLITQGFSQHVYEVTTTKQSYIAKYFAKNSTSFNNELTALTLLAGCDFFPQIIAVKKQLILMAKLPGNSLHLSEQNNVEKLTIAAQLMANCHVQPMPENLSSLNLADVIASLLTYSQLSAAELNQLAPLLDNLLTYLSQVSSKQNKVFCHGDINFTNIIWSGEKAYLLDFESASVMPAEYDMAMLLAVNELDLAYLPLLLSTYSTSITDQTINIYIDLVRHYYLLALLINGLWYLGKARETAAGQLQTSLINKAKNQFNLAPELQFICC